MTMNSVDKGFDYDANDHSEAAMRDRIRRLAALERAMLDNYPPAIAVAHSAEGAFILIMAFAVGVKEGKWTVEQVQEWAREFPESGACEGIAEELPALVRDLERRA